MTIVVLCIAVLVVAWIFVEPSRRNPSNPAPSVDKQTLAENARIAANRSNALVGSDARICAPPRRRFRPESHAWLGRIADRLRDDA